MVRDSGLHAALALAVAAVLGAILDHVGVGVGVGLLLAAGVTATWPPRATTVGAAGATERDEA